MARKIAAPAIPIILDSERPSRGSTWLGSRDRFAELAQTLLHRPTVLFLDEPTVGLDPSAREAVCDHVLELRNRFRTTMIVTSHRMEKIEQYCDQIVLSTGEALLRSVHPRS